MDSKIFAEGIALYNGKIFQLTWENQICFVYDEKTFNSLKEYQYIGQGWGITTDGTQLIMSDGTNILRFVNPDNFLQISTVLVTDDNKPVIYLNELEYIDGEVWANIWQKDVIARINPKTGKVIAWIDLSSLRDYLPVDNKGEVLNGIAYDAATKRIWVTGKYWVYIFEIKIVN